MYANKPFKLHNNKKTKHKNHSKSHKNKNYLNFHLDTQQDQTSINAKRQLQKLSQSSNIKNHLSARNKSQIQISYQNFAHWEQQYNPQSSPFINQNLHQFQQIQNDKNCHNFKSFQKRLSQLRTKTNVSNHYSIVIDQQQKPINNLQNIRQRKLLYTDYTDQQKIKQIGKKSKAHSLNLSFKNISTINSPTNFKISDSQTNFNKSRPTSSKKQLTHTILNVVPYGENGLLKAKKPRRHLRAYSNIDTNFHTKQKQKPTKMNFCEINGLNIYKSHNANSAINNIKSNEQKLNQTRNSFESYNFIPQTKCTYITKGVIGGYMKNSKSVKKNNDKGKWISTNSSKCNVKRVYKIQQYSSLNKDFARITKLLKQQIQNLGIHSTSQSISQKSKNN